MLQLGLLVYVGEPRIAVSGHRDLVVGPVAGQVNTDAGHDGRRVPGGGVTSHCTKVTGFSPQTHCGQVQRVGGHEVGGLGELLVG